ncbi:acetoin utilization deacetylase [Yasminevirus sp. GU-2018]|uniref:Acetoin utilization deacetylase n=1 Tax=Yasminevirus sp. GU-2018 TaxID=2420051 RepID=A0A5K0U9Y8_9VIRU|nr:acetoin utilization deacetylase [Yasminevirus sp. GU-2018]
MNSDFNPDQSSIGSPTNSSANSSTNSHRSNQNGNSCDNVILVGYSLSSDVKRQTRNRPEERQRKIVNAMKSIPNIVDTIEYNSFNPELYSSLMMVHDPDYVTFLLGAYSSFTEDRKKGLTRDHELIVETFDDCPDGQVNCQNDSSVSNPLTKTAMVGLVPNSFPTIDRSNVIERTQLLQALPVWRRVGFFCTDVENPIFAHTVSDAVKTASDTLILAEHLANSQVYKCAYSVTSNPGHHAGRDFYGGYCFINNAMIATNKFLELNTTSRVFVLDLDYHAGDGTNDIVKHFARTGFGDRLATSSIHMNPAYDYPNYRGFVHENTSNVMNVLFEPRTHASVYLSKLVDVISVITKFKPNYLVLAFGADTYSLDPEVVGVCELQLPDYKTIGELIGTACYISGCKLFITQEGGYNIQDVGEILTNLMSGINSTIQG